MNSNIFIKNYLISHGYSESVFKRRLIRATVLLAIFALLFTFANPLMLLRKQAMKNFANFTTNLKERLSLYSDFSKNYNLYDSPLLASANANSVTVNTNSVPLSGTITSGYGMRNDPITGKWSKHTGIDISGTHRAPVHSIEGGMVTFAGTQNGFGNCVEISHVIEGKNIYSFYAHLSSIDVKQGDVIAPRQVIGKEGGDPATDPNPGYSTGHHLHFEIRNKSGYGNDIDPTPYLRM